MTSKKGMALGRGLGALMGANLEEKEISKLHIDDDDSLKVIEIDINRIEPNKEQPRKIFDEVSLQEMAESIKNLGIIQPLTVKKKDDYYEIIAGERRWRAARMAKLKTVPVIIKEYDELQILEVSLIENIQRENLNPLEEAMTYKRLSDEFGMNQETIAVKVGKSRAAIANSMRLLNLDKRVQIFLSEGKISNGHARTLLGIENNDMQFEISEKIIDEQLSVRETEELVKRLNEKKYEENKKLPIKSNTDLNSVYDSLAKDLNTILGTKVMIKNGKNKGKIEIEYYSEDELDRLVCMFKKIQ